MEMFPAPLGEARRKLDRAGGHLDDLKAEDAKFARNPNRDRLLMEYDADLRCHVVYSQRRSHIIAIPPGHAPLILGDFLHNARGALDFITWQLASSHLKRMPTEKEAKGIQFPITAKPGAFWNSKVLSYISDDAARELAGHQPPEGPEGAKHELAILHSLSNGDKHRLLTPSVTRQELRWSYVLPVGITREREREPALVERRAWLHKMKEIEHVDSRPTIRPIRNITAFPLRFVYFTPADQAPYAEIEIKGDIVQGIAFAGAAQHVTVPVLEAVHERVGEVIAAFDRFL